MKNVFKKAPMFVKLFRTPLRFFSDPIKFLDYHNSEFELSQELHKELKQEVPNQEREDYIHNFLTKNEWTMETSNTTTRITLKKSVDNCQVKIYYDAKFPAEKVEDETETPDEQTENDDYLEFFVLLDKNKENQILLDVFSVDGELVLNGILVSPEAGAVMEKKTAGMSNLYNGPAFDSLDDVLQDKILNWVKTLGINEELAGFVEESAYHQEGIMYKEFLEKFELFLN